MERRKSTRSSSLGRLRGTSDVAVARFGEQVRRRSASLVHGLMKTVTARLKREVAKLKHERDILKKAAAYFAKELCEVLGVSRGGFYAWLTQPRTQRSRGDKSLVRGFSFLASDRTY